MAGVETATKISELVATNPPGSDPKSEGDNHLRLIKQVLQDVFDDSVAGEMRMVGNGLVAEGEVTAEVAVSLVDAAELERGRIAATETAGVGAVTITAKDELGDAKGALVVNSNGIRIFPDDTTKSLQTDFTNVPTGQLRTMRVPARAVASVPGLWEPIIFLNQTAAATETPVISDLGGFWMLRAQFRLVNTGTASFFSIVFSDNNGASFPAGATEYTQQQQWGRAAGPPGTALIQGTTFPLVTSGQVCNGPYGAWGSYEISDFNQGRPSGVNVRSGFQAGSDWFSHRGDGVCGRATAQNALKIISAQAFIGTMALEGLRA